MNMRFRRTLRTLVWAASLVFLLAGVVPAAQAASTPTVTSISPTHGLGGMSVTINGTDLNSGSVNAVYFGSETAPGFSVNPDGTVTATSPQGNGSVNVNVNSPSGTTGPLFTYDPTVTGLNPASGPAGGGTSVTVYGTGLSTVNAVYFGNAAATSFTPGNDTSLTAVSPAGSGAVDVTVYIPGGSSAPVSADLFTYYSSGGGGGGTSTTGLAISTTSLPAATVGQSYSQTIATNGEGTTPYTFSVTTGSLPDGLTLDAGTGVLSGTPTTAGTDSFTVTVQDAAEGSASESYTLTVNAAGTTPPGSAATTLTDIAGNWAQANIEKLVALGAITGYPDGTFRPANDITRAEFATVLVKALKLPAQPGWVFADTEGTWAQSYISTAAADGIVKGYDSSHFGPDDLITREQMTVMVVRAAKLAPATGTVSFSDAGRIDQWARDAVATAVQNGIVHDYPDGTFRPLGDATRAEAVTVTASLVH